MKTETLEVLNRAIKLLKDHGNADFVRMSESKQAAEELQTIVDEHQADFTTNCDIIKLILKEVARAEEKHPNWPKDQVYAAAIVSEESGELMRAAVQFEMENGDIRPLYEEAIQTAATCIRLLKN